MNHFGSELRFGLVKNTNHDSSFIYVVIPEVILKFLTQYQSELNIHLDKFTQFDDFPLTDNLKNDLYQWTEQYKKIPINEHNAIGQNLTEKVKEELGSENSIIFIPD